MIKESTSSFYFLCKVKVPGPTCQESSAFPALLLPALGPRRLTSMDFIPRVCPKISCWVGLMSYSGQSLEYRKNISRDSELESLAETLTYAGLKSDPQNGILTLQHSHTWMHRYHPHWEDTGYNNITLLKLSLKVAWDGIWSFTSGSAVKNRSAMQET